MRLSNAADLQRVLAADREPYPTRLALGYVTSTSGTQGQVTFDEDLTETSVPLTSLDPYAAVVGDRVLMGKVNGAWVILGRVNTGTVIKQPVVKFYSATLDATGYATVTHNVGFTPSAVVVTPCTPTAGGAASLIWASAFTDTFTATTFRVKGLHADATYMVGAVTFSAVLG